VTDVLFSIHPDYVREIYNGIKTVELRTRPPTKPFDHGYIYETAPIQLITGYFVPGTIYHGLRWDVLWRHYGAQGITGNRESTHYDVHELLGDKLWSAIPIKEAHRIKSIRLKGRPPQSWRYLNDQIECTILG
jgi:predicted transcriptional regulator